MDYNYHRNHLVGYRDLDYVREALDMLKDVEQSMVRYINDEIDTEQYIKSITPYDRFVWEKYTEKPQNTNLFNSKQKKKNSSWREFKWAPIFQKVRDSLNWENLQIIQNNPVIETVYDSGYIQTKNVDGGIGITTKLGVIPVVVVEDKAGNICSTTFNGINAQAWRLHQSFPSAKYVFITDNEFNVGQNKGSEIGNDVNLVVMERGNYRVKEQYPKLNAKRFETVRTTLIDNLKNTNPKDLLNYRVIESKSTGKLLDNMNDGIIYNL